MKAATERKIIRWMHIILSIPILGYIYGPVSTIPVAASMVRFVMLPAVVLSGLWLWKSAPERHCRVPGLDAYRCRVYSPVPESSKRKITGVA